MFQTNDEFLTLLGQFLITGFFIAIFCDIVRFLRIAFDAGKTAVFITDFLMTIFSALFLLFASIETSAGSMRLYYLLAALLGMAVYFVTVGVITGFIAKIVCKLLLIIRKALFKTVCKPFVQLLVSIKQKLTDFFEHLQQKTSKYKENLHFGLKKHTPMLYNNKIGKLCTNGGE